MSVSLGFVIIVVCLGLAELTSVHNISKSAEVLAPEPNVEVKALISSEPVQAHFHHEEELTIQHLDMGDDQNSINGSSVVIGSNAEVTLLPEHMYDQSGAIINPNPEIELGPFSSIIVHGNLDADCGCINNGNRKAHTSTATAPIQSLEETVASASEMEMYPNPFNENVVITFPSQEEVEVEYILFDIQGREVERGVLQSKQVNANEGQIVFRGAHLKEGIYLFQIQAGEKIHRGKLIKSE